MKCVFCKSDSRKSLSIEHIIPESLGNKQHILPKGVVCDACNNYFATQIENKVLSTVYFKSLRHRNEIPNKKNRIPNNIGYIVHPNGGVVNIRKINNHGIEIIPPNIRILNLIASKTVRSIYIPIVEEPEEHSYLISRFIGKIAFEALVERLLNVKGWNKAIIENVFLDNIRNYVRFGFGKPWPYNNRKIYPEDKVFTNSKHLDMPKTYQILHEYDFLFIDEIHLYFICAILGREYAINIGDRNINHYMKWLSNNGNKSPLDDEFQDRKKKDINKI